MQFEIKYRPAYSLLEVQLGPGEAIQVEAGSMAAMSADLAMDTTLSGAGGGLKALAGALGKKFLGGETMFVNTYTAGREGGQILIAPPLCGDIIHFPLREGGGLILQGSSFLAAAPGIKLEIKFGSWKSFLGGEGLFLLQAKGTGDLFANAYGGIEVVEVEDRFVVDTGHMVAFEPSLSFDIKKVGDWKSTLLSGEGLVCEFTGKGRLYLQTRNLAALLAWLKPLLPA